MKIVKLIFSSIFTLFILGCVAGGIFYFHIKSQLPNVNELKTVELQQPMQVFTADGKLIGEIGEQRRIPVPLTQIPQQMINAVIATEDSRFYEHYGIDPIGIARAVKVAITSGGASQGASTITQQVARNFFLTPEKKLIRKLKEIVLAIEIENNLSKDEILALYLNKIYLGYRAYGVAAAAQTYFGKTLDQLTLSEIAVLAGLPKAPSTMNPIYSLKRATERRNIVLSRMLIEKYITEAQYQQALQEPIIASYHGSKLDLQADYVVEAVRQEMVKLYGEEQAYTKGYQVFTTINSTDQLNAQKALRNNLIAYDMRHGYRKNATLWKADEIAWDKDRIIAFLNKQPDSKPLQPAAILEMKNNQAQAMLANGEIITLNQNAVKWAGNINKILHKGDMIWLIQDNKQQWGLRQIPLANSGMVSLDSTNGAIKAMVGGFSFAHSKFNRATQSMVQVGSSIKPFIYTAALNKGLTLATILNDAPITLRKAGQTPWQPKNSPNVFNGPLRLRVGLGLSKNVMMVRAVNMVGIDYIADYLQRFGFQKNQYAATEALALGAASFTPLEMARGYAVIDNGGFLIDPYIIQSIKDNTGNEIFTAKPKVACFQCSDKQIPVIYGDITPADFLSLKIDNSATEGAILDTPLSANTSGDEDNTEAVPDVPELNTNNIQLENAPSLLSHNTNDPQQSIEPQYAPRVISGKIAFLMRSALNSGIYGEPGGNWTGTSWRGKAIARTDIGGKTGTTNNSKVAWYVGYGGDLVTSVYIGFDDNKLDLGRGESGGKSAMPAWIDYMSNALKSLPVRNDPIPDGVIQKRISMENGLLSDSGGRLEYFIEGTEPTQYFVPEQGNQIIDSKGEMKELF
ncbi:penicillin-binding protein 1A [Gallibacterium trehalosifermentans]|uniref:Penicillin-binding protein 1A n=1 Tax=Gallibacterium trehalosifermentans TaxID=516935 RepID=A0ABV6H035_9PAST